MIRVLMPLFVAIFTIAPAVYSENLMIHAHAHNDYEHARPLLDALDNQFYSVEADVFLKEGDIVVAHDWGDFKGSLKELYLDPLQEIVDQHGSVHGDDHLFYLWIDFKDSHDETLEVLHQLLSQYPMISQYSDTGFEIKPVQVILTGDDRLKKKYVADYLPRYATRDSNSFHEDDPTATTEWSWYALSWNHIEKDDNRGTVTSEEIEALNQLTKKAHQKGRKVRFYACPDDPNYWQAALNAQVDLINTDKLEELKQFLSHQD